MRAWDADLGNGTNPFGVRQRVIEEITVEGCQNHTWF